MPKNTGDYYKECIENLEKDNNVILEYTEPISRDNCISGKCCVEGCNSMFSRSIRNIIKDKGVMCTYHLLGYKRYGNVEDVLNKIKLMTQIYTLDILTHTQKRKSEIDNEVKVWIRSATDYYKLDINNIKHELGYDEYIKDKQAIEKTIEENNMMATFKELFDNNGICVLNREWLENNTTLEFFNKWNYKQTKNKGFLLQNIAKSLDCFEEWKKSCQERHNKMLSESWKDRQNDISDRFETEKEQLKLLCEEKGVEVLNTDFLKEKYNEMYKIIFVNPRNPRNTFESIATEFGCIDEYKTYRSNLVTKKAGRNIRTREQFDKECEEILKKYGYFPCMNILRNNGYGMFVADLYKKEGYPTLDELNIEFKINVDTKRIARNGFKMDSEYETSFVNFLYCRGITMSKGRKYTNNYTELTGKNALYDLHFISPILNVEISVEIWGGATGARSRELQAAYDEKRRMKELSHKDDNTFLGINGEDCHKEDRLTSILKPYIGIIEPYVFANERDKVIHYSKWNLTDTLEKGATYICDKLGRFPSSNWMICKGVYKDRKRNDWEITPTFNITTFFYALVRFGISKLRLYMNIKPTVRRKYEDFYNIDGITKFIENTYKLYKEFPKEINNKYRNEQYRMKRSNSNCSFSNDYEELCKKCRNLLHIITDRGQDIINDEIYNKICKNII